jgi:hydroxyethylthiazole kinase-like uncharacterized protein yjeF
MGKKAIPFDTHKGIQGHALLIGGSYGKIGAITLASRAALQSGCGLVTALVPKCGYEILQIANPEVMVLTDTNENYLSEIAFCLVPDAIGIGPGLGQEAATQKALHKFLSTTTKPLVVDADALNILAQNPTWITLLPPESVLTPHPKELERLIGKWQSHEEKLTKTMAFAKQYQIIMVLKGAPTQIVFGNDFYENTTGNPALATAGSGDVLTGIITSLLAQSYAPIDAAILGVYLHGLTADIALPKTGYQSFIASTIIKYLGKAFLTLEKGE